MDSKDKVGQLTKIMNFLSRCSAFAVNKHIQERACASPFAAYLENHYDKSSSIQIKKDYESGYGRLV